MVRIEDIDLEILDVPANICDNCKCWKDFGEKCWFYWNGKKECSQRIQSVE